MPKIILENVTKRFEKFVAVDNLNMVIEDRSFITLLGPSGCGKTTTLRMIAGLETPTEGKITIDDKVVFSAEDGINVPPDKRDVGFLFQNYALWPHMTVNQNIAFGLENLKWSKEAIAERTKELLDMLKISEFGQRYPSELSGGQQQHEMGFAREAADKVLFMDEPLSNLDAKLRTEMRTELKRLHKDTDSTFIYVTHDQLEAMTLSTKVCLMKNGILQQYEPPLTVYNKPANTFTADFVGSPTINFVSGEDFVLICPNAKFTKENEILNAENVIVGIRPEAVQLAEDGSGIAAKVYSTLPSGMETILKLKLEGKNSELILTSVVFGDIDFEVDTKVCVSFNTKKMVLFDKTSTSLIDGGQITL